MKRRLSFAEICDVEFWFTVFQFEYEVAVKRRPLRVRQKSLADRGKDLIATQSLELSERFRGVNSSPVDREHRPRRTAAARRHRMQRIHHAEKLGLHHREFQRAAPAHEVSR